MLDDTGVVPHEFCTIFDADYLPRALAMYRSLEAVDPDFRLRAYCVEPGVAELLESLGLPRLIAVDIREVEAADPQLAAVRPDRTRGEYCWTATPSICLHSLRSDPALSAITYLDADLMFFADPAPLLDELGDASILIVPHRFGPRWDHCTVTHGTFNVEFNTFRRDEHGLAALEWWRERCLEWCYRRHEEGRFGDQLYLDEFPRRFQGVHILEHRGGGVAPWNSEEAAFATTGDAVTVDGTPLVFYHYTTLELYRGATARALARTGSALHEIGPAGAFRDAGGDMRFVWRPWPGYRISPAAIELVWRPYIQRLGDAIAELRALDPTFDRGFADLELRPTAAALARAALPPSVRRRASRLRQRAAHRRAH
jgi:hypothetical protein